MPEPVMRLEDLSEVARSAVFPFTVAHPGVAFEVRAEGAVPVSCDGRLIGQAAANLVKNAVEALTESRTPSPAVTVRVGTEEGEAFLAVEDNGPGLPDVHRHRLTEPYMTTREKGTGLGLAIVRKASEDHGGRFELGDAPGGGASARIILPSREAAREESRERMEA
jgi:two-component system nitrogen regulation sensor histidine kinase NtrY